MKSLIRIVGTSIVVAIAWAITKDIAKNFSQVRVSASCMDDACGLTEADTKRLHVKVRRYPPRTLTNLLVVVRVLRLRIHMKSLEANNFLNPLLILSVMKARIGAPMPT